MIELADYLVFIGVAAAITIAPGPDIIFVITQGITAGKRAGVMTALGLACGNFVHTTAVALGISVIFKTSDIAFWIFKILGALYLLYLAYKALKNKDGIIVIGAGGSTVDGYEAAEEPSAVVCVESNIKLMSRGFIMNVVNPKVALFFLAFLPQFTNKTVGSVPLQIIILGLTFIAIVVVIFGLLGFFAGYAGAWLTKYPGFNKGMSYVSSLIYVGIAVTILIAGRN